jgi:hypothetical protein
MRLRRLWLRWATALGHQDRGAARGIRTFPFDNPTAMLSVGGATEGNRDANA